MRLCHTFETASPVDAEISRIAKLIAEIILVRSAASAKNPRFESYSPSTATTLYHEGDPRHRVSQLVQQVIRNRKSSIRTASEIPFMSRRLSDKDQAKRLSLLVHDFNRDFGGVLKALLLNQSFPVYHLASDDGSEMEITTIVANIKDKQNSEDKVLAILEAIKLMWKEQNFNQAQANAFLEACLHIANYVRLGKVHVTMDSDSVDLKPVGEFILDKDTLVETVYHCIKDMIERAKVIERNAQWLLETRSRAPSV